MNERRFCSMTTRGGRAFDADEARCSPRQSVAGRMWAHAGKDTFAEAVHGKHLNPMKYIRGEAQVDLKLG